MNPYETFWNREYKQQIKRLRFNRGQPKDVILIVCEGKKTEPNYFKSFPLSNKDVKVVGAGATPLRVVKEAIACKRAGDKYKKFDQIWCVFDRDENSPQEFNNALDLARRNKFKVAYSNEAFELWFLLHFQFLDVAIGRHQYIEKLKAHLGDYKKNDPSIYDKLIGEQQTAIRNAAKLLSRYSPPNPCNDNPSTTVHLLVQELLKYC